MAYSWESEQIIMVSVSPDKIKKGTVIPAEWQQKFICRACKGVGCQTCGQLGYFTKKKAQSVQFRDKVSNGSWLRFVGAGDERPDCSGYGDAVIQIHIVGMEEPSSLAPELGGTTSQNDFGYIFDQFFGEGFEPTPVSAKLTVTSQEAKAGCAKHITVSTTSVCNTCEGSGIKPADSESICEHCNGSGHVVNEQKLLVSVPPHTKNNSFIRLSEKGDTKVHNGEIRTGDVVVTVKIKRFLF